MKFFARLSALGAVAVLSTAFASATIYQFGSYATGAPTLGNQNSAMVFDTVNSQANPGVIYTPATQTVDPGLVWAPNLLTPPGFRSVRPARRPLQADARRSLPFEWQLLLHINLYLGCSGNCL